MRTTLSLDEDVVFAIRERAQRENRTMGDLLSELARQALTNPVPLSRSADGESFHGFEPLPHRGQTISNELIDRLRDEEQA